MVFKKTRRRGNDKKMRPSAAPWSLAGKQSSAGNEVMIFCRLFADLVTEELCLLRRNELQAKGVFSCQGCIMDMLMRQQYAFLKNIVLSAWIDDREGKGGKKESPGPDDGQRFL